jgi:hypothetical protein
MFYLLFRKIYEGGRRWGNGEEGLIQYKYCVHMHVNGKMIPVQTIPGISGEGDKGE